MHTRRLFVGIDLSERLKKRLSTLVSDWEDYPVIPTRQGNFHITLIFLGFVGEEMISRITESLQIAAESHESFDLSFTAIEPQPDAERPNMIWLTGEPSDELRDLRNTVIEELEYLSPESKTYRPHITMAKVRRGRWDLLPEKPSFEKKLHLAESVDTITLFESTELDGKRAYLPLAEFPLGTV